MIFKLWLFITLVGCVLSCSSSFEGEGKRKKKSKDRNYRKSGRLQRQLPGYSPDAQSRRNDSQSSSLESAEEQEESNIENKTDESRGSGVSTPPEVSTSSDTEIKTTSIAKGMRIRIERREGFLLWKKPRSYDFTLDQEGRGNDIWKLSNSARLKVINDGNGFLHFRVSNEQMKTKDKIKNLEKLSLKSISIQFEFDAENSLKKVEENTISNRNSVYRYNRCQFPAEGTDIISVDTEKITITTKPPHRLCRGESAESADAEIIYLVPDE